MRNNNRLDFKNKVKSLEKSINYSFKHLRYLEEALTHSSYSNESKDKGIRHNERIEFLGDSVLNLVISDYIFRTYTSLSEGELTKIRANVVCEQTLSEVAKNIDLGIYLLLGKGEDLGGGRKRNSVLADALESLVGAMYLDGGLDNASRFIIREFETIVELASRGNINRDFKTIFQEKIQSASDKKITYRVVEESGPDHDKTFEIEIIVGEHPLARGKGRSKKEAEQDAAKKALERYDQVYE